MSVGLVIVLTVVWLALAITALIWGTAFLTRLFGKEECLPPGPFVPWLFVCGTIAALLAWRFRGLGFALLALVYAVPVVAATAWAIHLRLAEWKARRKDFGWRDDRLVSLTNGIELAPMFFKKTAAYLTTGPASGYCLYAIELHDSDARTIARNGYVHDEAVRRDTDRLLRSGCKTLDAVLVWKASPTVLYSVHLGAWTELLCAKLHSMPEDSARFWGRWIRPEFPAEGSVELATPELSAHIGVLLAAEPVKGEQLRTLLGIAGPTVVVMTERAQRSLQDQIRGPNGRSILEFDKGVAKTTIVPMQPD